MLSFTLAYVYIIFKHNTWWQYAFLTLIFTCYNFYIYFRFYCFYLFRYCLYKLSTSEINIYFIYFLKKLWSFYDFKWELMYTSLHALVFLLSELSVSFQAQLLPSSVSSLVFLTVTSYYTLHSSAISGPWSYFWGVQHKRTFCL